MTSRPLALFIIVSFAALAELRSEPNAGRLAYLEESDPFYVGVDFPKLTTPQWVGEAGVEAVAILAVDDMREAQEYETFLGPVLDRLKQIDVRGPVSVFCNRMDAQKPR